MTDNTVIDINANIGVKVEATVRECHSEADTGRGCAELVSPNVTHICSDCALIKSTPSLINERPTAEADQASNSEAMIAIESNKSQTIAGRVSLIHPKRTAIERKHQMKAMKRSRHNFDGRQTLILETIFDNNTHYPDGQTIDALAVSLRTPAQKIQIWFQNRRAKFRRNGELNVNRL